MLILSLLGPTQITLDGRPLSFRTNKVQALLCYLAVEGAGRPAVAVRREALMELLWPDMPLRSAQDNLRQTLYQLRKTVPETAGDYPETAGDHPETAGDYSVTAGDHPETAGGQAASQPFILSDRTTIQLNPEAAYRVDVAEFQSLLEGRPTADSLQKAVDLYRGDFLADFYLPDSNDFEAWSAAKRLHLRHQALDALETLSASLMERRLFNQAESYARRQLEIDNLRESAHRQVMRALAENGRRPEAIQHYQLCRQLLQDELDVEPSAETTALYQQIRAADSTLSKAVPAIGPTTAARRHNLPAQTTSFVGRQEELAEVLQLLADPNCRLLTLIGPGGIGKTRLSLQAADTLARSEGEHFPDGVFVVPLAAVSTIEQLVPAIADAIGFDFSGPREPRRQLLAFLKPRRLLLVLDNLEHLAAESSPIADFLAAVPGLTFLVTSRARLNLYEEWRYELKGLAIPPEQETVDLEKYSAVQLFIQRARQAGPALSLEAEMPFIGQICQLLEGLPLGIELAAGWVRTHTCAQIAAEIEGSLDFLTTTLQNIPERHRSLHVVFERSWQLLSDEGRAIFARSTVFRGGFSQEAAKFVTGASSIELAGLVDNSMVQVSGGRFHTNELLRQFGSEKLTKGELPEARERHAAFFAGFLQERKPFRWKAEESAALNEIGVELRNILAAWHWTTSLLGSARLTEVMLDRVAQSAAMLVHFFDLRGRYHEGVRLFQETAAALTAARRNSAQPERFSYALARVQAAEGGLRFHLSQFGEVETLVGDSLSTFRRGGKREETAAALVLLGMTKNRLGLFEEANDFFEESRAIFQQLGQRTAEAEALNGLGIVAVSLERFDEARDFLQASLAIYKETGYLRGIARALSNLGTSFIRSGRYSPALPLYEEALEAARAANDTMIKAAIQSNMGSISRILGRYEMGLHYYEESLAVFRETGERRWVAVNLNGLGETLLDMGRPETAEQHLRQSLEIATAIQSVPDILDSLAALGQISAESGRAEEAVVTLTFVALHPVTKPLSRGRAERVLAQLRPMMPPQLWESLKRRGEGETIEGLNSVYCC